MMNRSCLLIQVHLKNHPILFFDIYGNYENMWWLSVALGIVAFILTITVKEEPFSVNSEIKEAV